MPIKNKAGKKAGSCGFTLGVFGGGGMNTGPKFLQVTIRLADAIAIRQISEIVSILKADFPTVFKKDVYEISASDWSPRWYASLEQLKHSAEFRVDRSLIHISDTYFYYSCLLKRDNLIDNDVYKSSSVNIADLDGIMSAESAATFQKTSGLPSCSYRECRKSIIKGLLRNLGIIDDKEIMRLIFETAERDLAITAIAEPDNKPWPQA